MEPTNEFETDKRSQATDNLLQAIFASMEDAIFVVAPKDRTVLAANPAMERMFGYSVQEVLGRSTSLIHPDHAAYERWNQLSLPEIQSKGVFRSEWRLRRKNGQVFWTEITVRVIDTHGSWQDGVVSVIRDISERKNIMEKLRLRDRALEASANGIMICKAKQPDWPVTYVNPALQQITGYSADEIIGRSPRFLSGTDQHQKGIADIRAGITAERPVTALVRNYRRDGTLFWNSLSVAPVPDSEGKVTHFIGIINDVTESKTYEEALEKKSNYDELTDLANRNLLADRLQQAIVHSRRTGTLVALFLLDLDRFQILNDSLGHLLGDELLKRVGERLTSCVRAGDTVARLGGDEFVLLFQELENAKDLPLMAEKIQSTLSAPFSVGGHRLGVSASIGIAIYPRDGQDGNLLLRNADLAMYHAKDSGRNNFQFFDAEMDSKVIGIMSLESDLRNALENHEFFLDFQPKVDVSEGRIVGSEALVRWRHPKQGVISPSNFIPLAEQTGLIEPLSEWVLCEACRINGSFQKVAGRSLPVAVNISAKLFRSENLFLLVERILESCSMDPRLLCLELTESMLMERPEEAGEIMARLKNLGVSLSLDDFGTGYSCLSYLRRFPFDSLKIDRSFIIEVATNPGCASVAKSIIDIGQNLDMETIAEGVETESQLQFLRDSACQTYQGFLFSRPTSPESFKNLLENATASR